MLNVEIRASERGDRGAILRGLRAYNTSNVGLSRWKPLLIVAREGRRIAGGLRGESSWDWLFVRHLWVHERHRGDGLGRRLLRLAEKEARRRGCTAVWLDTYDFQAPRFYKRLGYREFGRLAGCPVRGHRRFFLYRVLSK